MLLRRLLLFAAALLLVAALASALAPREDTAGPQPTGSQPDVAPALPAPVVRADLPRDRVVEAEVGDVVELQVTAAAPDQAEIPKLGVKAPADVGVPAQLTFVADQPGRFGVRLRFSGEKVGVIDIGDGSR
jgi:hypothetical protein